MKQLPHVQNIILGAVDDDGVYAGDDADDNYDGDANWEYDQDYEFTHKLHLMQCKLRFSLLQHLISIS